MNELELLDRLKIIDYKLIKGEKLTDFEYKLLSLYLLGVALGIFKYTVEWALKSGIIKGGDNHE